MNPPPEQKDKGDLAPEESEPIQTKPLPEMLPKGTWRQRFLFGLVVGGLGGFFASLYAAPYVLIESLIFTLASGLIIGILGALFGDRVLGFLLEIWR